MSGQKIKYYIGWDVGAWKCKPYPKKSCDALVVIREGEIVGFFRSNLSPDLFQLDKENHKDARWLIKRWLKKCGIKKFNENSCDVTIALDTPLGWPILAFDFLTYKPCEKITNFLSDRPTNNPITHRYVEKKIGNAMSVITDSIGSQSSKGIFFIRESGFKKSGWGQWENGNSIKALESYPKACLRSPRFNKYVLDLKLQQQFRKEQKEENDLFDAAILAVAAKAFEDKTLDFELPPDDDEKKKYEPEGWIYYPKDCLVPSQDLDGCIPKNPNTDKCFDEVFREFISNSKNKNPYSFSEVQL